MRFASVHRSTLAWKCAMRKAGGSWKPTRRPEAIQGSVRAIWESLDMTRAAALQNGILFTHIGNPQPGDKPALAPKQKPRFR